MPCVRVECSSRARPTIAALEVVAGRTKSSAISALAMPNPAGAAVRMAAPSGPSATKASAPARKTPSAADCHHGEAGIAMAAVPIPTSVIRRSVSRVSGGSGARRSSMARSSSWPPWRASSNGKKLPRYGSATTGGCPRA